MAMRIYSTKFKLCSILKKLVRNNKITKSLVFLWCVYKVCNFHFANGRALFYIEGETGVSGTSPGPPLQKTACGNGDQC